MSVTIESSGANLRRVRVGWPHPQRIVLAALVLMELVIFSVTGTNFANQHNFLEIGRLALAMTPVIVAGGIDLSVGSLMGLCAVFFGKMWRDAGMSPWIAAAA